MIIGWQRGKLTLGPNALLLSVDTKGSFQSLVTQTWLAILQAVAENSLLIQQWSSGWKLAMVRQAAGNLINARD